jgi:hypothetical protein
MDRFRADNLPLLSAPKLPLEIHESVNVKAEQRSHRCENQNLHVVSPSNAARIR